MNRAIVLLVLSTVCLAQINDHDALVAIGNQLNWKGWKNNKNWMSSQDHCTWYGVVCDSNSNVIQLNLYQNNLKGPGLPNEIYGLANLQVLDLTGTQPESYSGCIDMDFQYAPLPDGFYQLTNLQQVWIENTCTGGTISGSIQGMKALQIVKFHANQISGSIPWQFATLHNLKIFDLGRNPLTGTFPIISSQNLGEFNCNFCSLTGTLPSNAFNNMPNLYQAFWDGNGFTGPLPDLSQAPSLTGFSFNMNNFNSLGGISSICGMKQLVDCRIGADLNYEVYQANYPWIQPAQGNYYPCPIDPCVLSFCNNSAHWSTAPSPIECS